MNRLAAVFGLLLLLASCSGDSADEATSSTIAPTTAQVTTTTTSPTSAPTTTTTTTPTTTTTITTTTITTTTTTTTAPTTTTTTTPEPLPVPTGLSASTPCGSDADVCLRWDVIGDPRITSFDIFRGEQGAADTYLTSVAAGDLYVVDGRYEFIDFLGAHPPSAADPWPLCYAVSAVAGTAFGPRSAPACAQPTD